MIISALTLLAVVMGMSFLLFNTKIHKTAVSVLIEKSLNEALSSPEDKASVRIVVSPSAGTVRPGWQWRERVRAVVQHTAAAKDYRLYKALYDKPDYPDLEARTVFLFKSSASKRPLPHGVLVLTPEDYLELWRLDKAGFEAAIDQRLFGRWITDHGQDGEGLAAFGKHVVDIASVLYAQPRIEQVLQVSLQLPVEGAPMIVECGNFHLSLDSTMIDRLLEHPAIERDRNIAELIEKLDPETSPYLR